MWVYEAHPLVREGEGLALAAEGTRDRFCPEHAVRGQVELTLFMSRLCLPAQEKENDYLIIIVIVVVSFPCSKKSWL